jgi:hypothetical protein
MMCYGFLLKLMAVRLFEVMFVNVKILVALGDDPPFPVVKVLTTDQKHVRAIGSSCPRETCHDAHTKIHYVQSPGRSFWEG